MEGRLPPDDGDDLFEWTDSPARPPREPEPPEEPGEEDLPAETGERDQPAPEPRQRRSQRPRPSFRIPIPKRRAPRRETRERRAARGDTGERRAVRGETGEFERSGRRPPPGRRARRRDLPARVRRRQDIIVGLIALAVLIGLIVAIAGGGGGGGEQPIGLKKLIGQTIVAKLGKKPPDKDLLESIRRGQVGSLIVLPKDAQSLQAGVRQAQQAASAGDNPPLLVMIDQEGAGVKRLPDGPPDLSPHQLGAGGSADESKSQGQKTGSYLKQYGVNVDLAPVLDVSQPETDRDIASRTFGTDPSVVSDLGVAFAEGLQDGGVLATPKHFPGLGRATVTTDQRAVTIATTTQDLQSDLQPFQAAVDAGMKLVMVSTARYPGLEPAGSKQPAAFSPQIIKGLLRDRFGFDGVVITDDLEAPSIPDAPGTAGAKALRAGADLLLFAKSPGASGDALSSLVNQVKQGGLDRSVIQSAYDRVTSLKGDLP
jgi:beta-N-acetylhexosaminidase